MPSTVERFFQVLSEIVPDYKQYLNPPCDPALFAEIENLIGEELPAAFKEFYSIADGEIPSYVFVDGKYESQKVLWLILGFSLASLSEIINSYKDDTYPKRLGNTNDYNSHNDFYYHSNCFSSDADKIKTHIYFHKKWLPIAFNECCDAFLLDFAPAEKGVKGQIFVHNCAGDSHYWEEYASSFEEFIQKITAALAKNGDLYKQEKYLWNWDEFDYNSLAIKANQPFIDDIQREKFDNLPFEWKEYFQNFQLFCKIVPPYQPDPEKTIWKYEEVTTKKLSEIRQIWSNILTEEQLKTQYKGILPKSWVTEHTYKTMLQDITPLILLPKFIELRFWFEINLSQLDFVSQYLTHIYNIEIPNIFQQEDLKILGKFKRLFALHLKCGKIDDFSDLLTCKVLVRLTINSSEVFDLSALWDLKELEYLDIYQCPHIEDFSAFSKVKNSLRVVMTREQFLKTHTYMDKNKIKPLLIVPYGVVLEPATAEEQIIINAWFDK